MKKIAAVFLSLSLLLFTSNQIVMAEEQVMPQQMSPQEQEAYRQAVLEEMRQEAAIGNDPLIADGVKAVLITKERNKMSGDMENRIQPLLVEKDGKAKITIEDKTITVDVRNCKATEIEKAIFGLTWAKTQVRLDMTGEGVNVFGAVNMQGSRAPGRLSRILADCGGINWVLFDEEVSIKDVTRRDNDLDVISWIEFKEGKDPYVPPGAIVDFKVSGGVHTQTKWGTTVQIISILGSMGLGLLLGANK